MSVPAEPADASPPRFGSGLLTGIEGAVEADDLKGVLVVEGPRETADFVRSIVQQFDVAPMGVHISVSIDSSVDKTLVSMTGHTFNHQTWTTGDSATGVLLTLCPRVNADNTVTISVNYKRDTERLISFVTRLENNVNTPIFDLIQSSASKKSKLPVPKITLLVNVQDPQFFARPRLQTPN